MEQPAGLPAWDPSGVQPFTCTGVGRALDGDWERALSVRAD